MPHADEPMLLAAEPQLFVTDLNAARAFYVDRLGFSLVFSHGDPPFYAQVGRGGARLNLRLVHASAFAADFHIRETDPLSATIIVNGIDRLFPAYEAAGVEFHQRLRSEPWGSRTFIVRDPDGNLIAFAGE
jgi:catechol 2,3-dioxygenase-like lactoylglutathione lyase family enzyme